MNIKEKCQNLIKHWIEAEDGSGEYKLTGRYWEVLYPILKKYAQAELASYEMVVGEFDYFNEDVRSMLDTEDDEENFNNSIRFMNYREDTGASNNDIDYVDLGDDNILAYIPNQNIDQNSHFGRENSE